MDNMYFAPSKLLCYFRVQVSTVAAVLLSANLN